MTQGTPEVLPPSPGHISEAPPMVLAPGPIKAVVYGVLASVILGYGTLMFCFASGLVKEAWPLSILGLHTVGMFGLLLRYFGGSLKVTATSAETGR